MCITCSSAAGQLHKVVVLFRPSHLSHRPCNGGEAVTGDFSFGLVHSPSPRTNFYPAMIMSRYCLILRCAFWLGVLLSASRTKHVAGAAAISGRRWDEDERSRREDENSRSKTPPGRPGGRQCHPPIAHTPPRRHKNNDSEINSTSRLVPVPVFDNVGRIL